MNYSIIYMHERAKKVDYILDCLNKGMFPSALIISRTYNKLRGKIININFEYVYDEVYPAISVTMISESEMVRKSVIGTEINSFYDVNSDSNGFEVSIDDIAAFYLKDETKLEEKTMTDKEKFTPKRINFRSKNDEYYTDVLWADGTVTVVKLKENEDFDEYTAFCAALAKKVFGSTNAVNNIVKKTACYPLTKAQKKSIGRMKKAIDSAK